jgi:PPOX class probable F420-dependent enzyme
VVDGDIAIAVDEKPKSTTDLARIRDIRRDRRVTLLVDRYDDNDWSRLAWLRIEANATVLERGDDWLAALDGLRARYDQYREMALESRPMLRLAPTCVTGWRP